MFANMLLIVIVLAAVCSCDENIESKKIQTRGVYGYGRSDHLPPPDSNKNNFNGLSRGPPRPDGGYHHSMQPHNHDPSFHHFHPDLHHHHHGEDVKPWVQTEEPTRPQETVNFNYVNSSVGIPLELARTLNEYDSIAELLNNEVEGAQQRVQVAGIASRFGANDEDENVERSSAKLAVFAKCKPELTVVKIGQSNDPNVFFIPECTRIERCGGCCKHDLLSCQPIEVEQVHLTVHKTKYKPSAGKPLIFKNMEPVTLEKHTKCKCMCKIKAEDCNAYQEYNEPQCRCVCKNTDEEQKCYRNSDKKQWNPYNCACECREDTPCSTGYNFDYNECRCVQTQFQRRYILSEVQKQQNQEPEE